MRKLKKVWGHFCEVSHKHHKTMGRTIFGSHVLYYGMVSLESHGSYGIVAGLVAALLVWEAAVGQAGGVE